MASVSYGDLPKMDNLAFLLGLTVNFGAVISFMNIRTHKEREREREIEIELSILFSSIFISTCLTVSNYP